VFAKMETEKEKYWASIFFFINGVLFGITWERLGTNHAWSYADFGPMIAGIPFVICLSWGIYSLFSTFLYKKSANYFLYSSPPLVLSLFIEPCAVRLGFWKYFFLKGNLWALLPYFIIGYFLITISFNMINCIGWKYISKQKNPIIKVIVILSCTGLFAIGGLFVYSILSIIHFKKIPTWLFSRLLFD